MGRPRVHMMKFVAILGVLALAAAIPVDVKTQFTTSSGAALFEQEFEQFKAEYSKVYETAEHEAKAFVAFVNNLDFIRNFKDDSVTVAINEFADMTHEEFKAAKLGYKPSERVIKKILTAAAYDVPDGSDLADSIDWVSKGAVTPVKNQAQCGSCWAFSTTGSIEGAIFNQFGTLESISEQELVSCDKVDDGCQGGSMDNGFTFAKKNGLALEKNYPYTSGTGNTGTCNSRKSKKAAPHSKVAKFTDVTPNSETALKEAVAKGPVSVAIEADKQVFQFYKSGVIKASAGCGTNLDHGVLAVGYGTQDGTMYWKVKNSWGATWGDNGYVMLERKDSKRGSGTCGIAMDASYPTMASSDIAVTAALTVTVGTATAGAGPYEDPKPNGCASDEVDIQIQGVTGDFCTPACSASDACPAFSGSATPQCALQDASTHKTYCALICNPSANDDACGANASCKSIQGTGICTYDD